MAFSAISYYRAIAVMSLFTTWRTSTHVTQCGLVPRHKLMFCTCSQVKTKAWEWGSSYFGSLHTMHYYGHIRVNTGQVFFECLVYNTYIHTICSCDQIHSNSIQHWRTKVWVPSAHILGTCSIYFCVWLTILKCLHNTQNVLSSLVDCLLLLGGGD